MTEVNPIEALLETESDSEKVDIESPSDFDAIVEKAEDKHAMLNVPTERKTAEGIAKLTAQVHAAEAQQDQSNKLRAGGVDPNHQTYGVLGLPLAAAVHDFDIDPAIAAQGTVKSKNKDDQKKIDEHNDSLRRIVENIEKENEK